MPTKTLPGDLRKTRRYQAIRLVVLRQEPACWLRMAGCRGRSTTADHIIPVVECLRMGRPDLIVSRENLRAACLSCNAARRDRSIDSIRHLMGVMDRLPMRVFD